MSECHDVGRLSKLSRFSKDRRGELAKERNLSAATMLKNHKVALNIS